jgi:hypothetical protein
VPTLSYRRSSGFSWSQLRATTEAALQMLGPTFKQPVTQAPASTLPQLGARSHKLLQYSAQATVSVSSAQVNLSGADWALHACGVSPLSQELRQSESSSSHASSEEHRLSQ